MRRILKKLGKFGFTFFVVVNISFVLLRLLPGGPEQYIRAQLMGMGQGIAGGDMTPAQIDSIIQSYLNVKPSQPLYVQWIDYMSALVFRGDLGTSIWYQESVTSIYIEALPWTLFLMGISIILVYVIGLVLGAMMAYYEGTRFDMGMTTYGIVAAAIPFYLLAVILIFLFAVQWSIFPIAGRSPSGVEAGLTAEFVVGVVRHGILPIASVVLTFFGIIAITMRGNSIRVLGEDYLRVARLRGLSDQVITTRYVGRNAILPLYTQLMIALGSMFGGSVILETIFIYRGMGYYLWSGVNSRDYPLVMGGFIIITLTVLVGILIAELTYGWLDPRAGETSERF